MTAENPRKLTWVRFVTYVSQIFWPLDEIDTVAVRNIRATIKWLFDLVRNAFIVGGLKYLAIKSNSWLLNIIWQGAFLTLLLYCFSYTQTWHLRFLRPWWPANWAKIGDMLISLAIILPLLYIIVQTIPAAIDEIAKAQVK